MQPIFTETPIPNPVEPVLHLLAALPPPRASRALRRPTDPPATHNKDQSKRQSRVRNVSRAGIRWRGNGRCWVRRSECARAHRPMPHSETRPFRAAQRRAVRPDGRGDRRPRRPRGSGIPASTSSQLHGMVLPPQGLPPNNSLSPENWKALPIRLSPRSLTAARGALS
jgi:hypothetical protein